MSYRQSNLCFSTIPVFFSRYRRSDEKGFSYLELLGEGVGVVQLHDVLHKLLHRQRLVIVCSQREETRVSREDREAVLARLASIWWGVKL